MGSQVLPVLLALPDVEVPAGTRPTFTDAQVLAAVEETLGDAGGRLRRKVVVAARVALVRDGPGAAASAPGSRLHWWSAATSRELVRTLTRPSADRTT